MHPATPLVKLATLLSLVLPFGTVRGMDIEPGGFLALQSGSRVALKAPWELAAGELGVSVTGLARERAGLDLTLALADGATSVATARIGWQVMSGLELAAGRQDLPFARDRERFAAPDRPCIHAPLTTDEGLDGGLSAESLVATLGAKAGWKLEGWQSRAVFAERGNGQGLRVSRVSPGLELGLSAHHEHHGAPLLAAVDGRWHSLSAELLARRDSNGADAWGWNLDGTWSLGESGNGRTELLTGLENWLPAAGDGQWVTRLALSHHLPPGVIARVEQRHCSDGAHADFEYTMQLILPL